MSNNSTIYPRRGSQESVMNLQGSFHGSGEVQESYAAKLNSLAQTVFGELTILRESIVVPPTPLSLLPNLMENTLFVGLQEKIGELENLFSRGMSRQPMEPTVHYTQVEGLTEQLKATADLHTHRVVMGQHEMNTKMETQLSQMWERISEIQTPHGE